MRGSLFALALLALVSPAAAEPGGSAAAGTAQDGSARAAEDRGDSVASADEQDTSARSSAPAARPYWHLPRKRERDLHPDPSAEGAPDWNPLSRASKSLKAWLGDAGIRFDLDVALYGQHASETLIGDANLGTVAWQTVGDWQFLQSDRFGKSFVQWEFLGSTGLNYDTGDRSMSGNVGSISGLNANVYPDHGALDELFLKHVSPGGELVAVAGRVDPTAYFDTNRVANDAFREFFAFARENNLSIPFATYGGIGALVRYAPTEDLYFMAANVTAVNDEAWAFWRSADDGDWTQLAEIGLIRDVPYLGKGQYRVIPWHSHRFGGDGWGLGLNFDQELGFDRLVAFFRFGIGDDDVAFVERFASGGLALERPFGRSGDQVSAGVAWSNPSPGAGSRNETLLEVYYRLQVTPSISISPDLQIVLDPANNPNDDAIFIGGIRLEFRL